MARIFLFRGKTPEEVQKLSNEEFTKLLNSRERRAMKRQGTTFKELQAKVEKYKKLGKDKALKTQVREAVILPSWLGMKFAVHNGKEWKEMTIVPEMLGHRLGEFVFSTKRVMHSAPGIRATRGSKFLSVK
jgi:small subunit ribosomal protein S19